MYRFKIGWTEGLSSSHAVYSVLLLFHLYSTTSSSERSVLSAIFTSGTAAKHRVHFYYDFVPFVLFFLLTPVRGFNPYSVVDLLNVLSSSGVTCAPSPQLITAGGGGGGGRRVETEIMLNCSHCCFLKKKKRLHTARNPNNDTKNGTYNYLWNKKVSFFCTADCLVFESSIYIFQYFCFISI